jgi:hypothetical protein
MSEDRLIEFGIIGMGLLPVALIAIVLFMQ